MENNPEQTYLAFGTPCQIYGLASVLERKKMRNRAILVDLFCHGVPSYLVWEEYLKSLQKHLKTDKLTDVVFRDKSIGWHNFVIRLDGGQHSYKESSEGDLFYHAFFDNVLFSKACFDCPVRKEISKADIRLGDYWGKRYQNRDDGVSAVLLLTEEGKDFFQKIRPWLIDLDPGTVEEVLTSQSVGVYGTVVHREKAFLDLMSGKGLKKTISAYRKGFSVPRRVKLFLKEGSSKLPDGVRATIRRIYKKL